MKKYGILFRSNPGAAFFSGVLLGARSTTPVRKSAHAV